MTYEELKEYHEQRPFKPFDIKMSHSRVYTVNHPEFLSQSHSRKFVLFITDDDREVVLDVHHITTLEIANTYAA